MATIYAVKILGGKVQSLAAFNNTELPAGFTKITEEKYNYIKENLTPFSKYNSVTGLLEDCTESIAAYELAHVAIERARRIKEVIEQQELITALTALDETNELAAQQTALTTMINNYKADYPEILP